MNQNNKVIDVKDIPELELKAIGFEKITQIDILTSELKMIQNELARRANLPKEVQNIPNVNASIEETLKDIVKNEEASS